MKFEDDKELVEENIDVTEENFDNNESNNDRNNMRKKLMKIMLLLVGILVIILIVILISSLVSSRELEYEKIETKMKDAAVEYYEVQKGLLPQEEGEVVSVDASTLSKNEYMKPLNELRKDESCTGKVEVSKIGKEYVYTPYLKCGDEYNTKELYKAVLEQDIVTSGSGLYQINNEKVYRGESVNNYVQLDNNLFRIVKVTSDNKIMLVLDNFENSYAATFDDRYNIDKGYNSGFNDYTVSRLYSSLVNFYEGKAESVLLTNNDKKNLVPFNLCIGKRTADNQTKDNSIECSNVFENQMIGLLTASEYLMASIDNNCISIDSRSCQNYNYLSNTDYAWWVITAVDNTTNKVFYIDEYGDFDEANASSSKRLRPTIMVSNRAMLKSGNGSANKPFVLK